MVTHQISEASRVYLIAISGTGMSALAGLLKEKGCVVGGTDVACYSPVKDLLEKLEIQIDLGYHLEHLIAFKPDYVVIGNFVRRDNPLAQYVLSQNIPYGSLPSTLENYFLQDTRNFVVVGTHGKSTTSTCLTHLLYTAQRDPSFFVGAVSQEFGQSFRLGSGGDFVLEGDEYDSAFFDKESKFLHYRPQLGVWTSLEFDHADIFNSLEEIERMFYKFVQLIPEEGVLIYCRDYDRIHQLVSKEWKASIRAKVVSYGFHSQADFQITEFQESKNGIEFCFNGQLYSSALMGNFNTLNFSAALLAAQQAGLSSEDLKKGIASFKGLKRRQEVRVERKSSRVIDDFAHHPTAVREMVSGVKKKYPNEKIVVFFEPRSNTTRRAIFQDEFIEAFERADVVLLPEVFRKEALPEDDRLDVSKLVRTLQQKGVDATGPLSIDEMETKARVLLSQGACSFVVLSNGSFDGLHQKLISLVNSH